MLSDEILFGFRVIREKPLPELSAVMYELEHQRTGLKLLWLKRPEENMTFGIAFTTLPWDDTGVFHILEHSVLGGSRHYPVKDPFLELLKSSLNTFLNALTFPDRTFYPVSSRNRKDFMNLVHIYLDAVFCPSIYDRPEIFRQEGWHMELDETGAASYKGVVFNEMKGALADPDEQLDMAVNRALFPETPYRFVSGGDPASIPDLSYSDFLETHRRFYSPSNAFVFLDGDLDLEAVLALLENEYLRYMDAGKRIAPPVMQKPVDGGTTMVTYELPAEEDPEDRYRFSMASVIGTFADREKLTAAQILSRVLTGGNQAPLVRPILSAGLAEDVSLELRDGISQPYLALNVRNCRKENIEQIEFILSGCIQDLISGGLDHAELEAVIANEEFRFRERDFGSWPQGLIYGFNVLDSWLFGGLPEANLEAGTLYSGLREKIAENWFEDQLRAFLIDSPHHCRVIMEPSHHAGEERRQLETERLQRRLAAMTPEEKNEILTQQKTLMAWQSTQDSPEQLAMLPRLGLEDIDPEPEKLPVSQKQINGYTVLEHILPTSGIAYITAWFDMTGADEQEISAMSFLCELLGQTSTAQHTPEELLRLTRLYCGGISFNVENISSKGGVKTLLRMSLSTLEKNIVTALKLASELLTSTTFDNGSHAFEILRQKREDQTQHLTMAGHQIALGRTAAMYSAAAAGADCAAGYDYLVWLKKQESSWNWEELSAQLKTMLSQTVCTSGMTLSVTSSDPDLPESAAAVLSDLLPAGTPCRRSSRLSARKPGREGIVIPADICFASAAGDYRPNGGVYRGAYAVASRILSLEYLWNRVRVQGGAYGAGCLIRPDGVTGCYSYRDPNGAASLPVFEGCGRFLSDFLNEHTDLTGYIIGTVSDAAPLLTPRLKGQTSDIYYWKGITDEERCRRWNDMIHCGRKELLEAADVIEKTLNGTAACIVGPRPQLDAAAPDRILSF